METTKKNKMKCYKWKTVTMTTTTKNCQTQNSIPTEDNFQRWREIQASLENKKQVIHCQQTSLTIHVKKISLGRGNMVADGNLDLYKQWRKSETEQIKVKLILNCLL